MWKSVLMRGVLAALLASGAAGPAAASDDAQKNADQKAAEKGRAVINFADLPGRIDGWRAEGDQTLYLKVGVDDWYRAELMSPCIGLQFTESIGLVTKGLNRVDKFSSILVEGAGGQPERCWFKSLTKVDEPGGDSPQG